MILPTTLMMDPLCQICYQLIEASLIKESLTSGRYPITCIDDLCFECALFGGNLLMMDLELKEAEPSWHWGLQNIRSTDCVDVMCFIICIS